MGSIDGKINLKLILPALAAACLIIFLSGCGPRKTAGPPVADVPEVSVITVKTEEAVLTAELPGRATAFLVAEVRPQVGGIIQKRLFVEGAEVKGGELLYQIDPSLYQATYDRTKAELDKSEAKIISAKSKYERYKVLIESKAISQQDFDNSKSDFYTAEADIHACKAAMETARINLEYTKIVAPISGRIGKSDITVGALVMANHAMSLATIQQLDPIYVDVTQSSTTLLRLKQEISSGLMKRSNGEEARVKLILDNGTPYPLEGILQFRDVTVDRSTGSFILRIVFPNPDNVLLPGMFVRAVVGIGIKEHAILIPQQAVSRNQKGEPVALIVDATGKVGQRILGIDRAISDKWLVSTGLAPGDRVIVEGMQKVRSGVEVKEVPFVDARKPEPDSTNAARPAAATK